MTSKWLHFKTKVEAKYPREMHNLDYLFYDSSKSDEQYRNSELPVKSSVTCENNNKSFRAEEKYLNSFFKGQDFHSASMLLAMSIAPLTFPLSLSQISGRGWERREGKLAWNGREGSPGDL